MIGAGFGRTGTASLKAALETLAYNRTAPPERLLVYEVKQGWEPLCTFLGVPVPKTLFSHVNDSDRSTENMQEHLQKGLGAR